MLAQWIMFCSVLLLVISAVILLNRKASVSESTKDKQIQDPSSHPEGCDCFNCKPYGLSGDSPADRTHGGW